MKLVSLTVTIDGLPDLTQTFLAPFNIIRKLSTFLINNETESIVFTIGNEKFNVLYENIDMLVSEDAVVIEAYDVLQEANIKMTSYDILETINSSTNDINFRTFYNWWEQTDTTTD